MDNSKTIFEKERREEKSKLVNIKFTDDNLFNILDEEGKSKYHARVDPPFCECPSFEFGNTEEYLATHSDPFLCKHLIHAIGIKALKTETTSKDILLHRMKSIDLLFNQIYVSDEHFVIQMEFIMAKKLNRQTIKTLYSKKENLEKENKKKSVAIEHTQGLIDKRLLLE